MWLKNLLVEILTANVTLEHLYTDTDQPPSYSQLTGLTYDRPDKGQRETFKAYFFFLIFSVNSV